MRVAVVLKRVGLVHTFGRYTCSCRYVSFDCYIAICAHVAMWLLIVTSLYVEIHSLYVDVYVHRNVEIHSPCGCLCLLM